jgi:hypothetical protein
MIAETFVPGSSAERSNRDSLRQIPCTLTGNKPVKNQQGRRHNFSGKVLPTKFLLNCDSDHTTVRRPVLFSAHDNGSKGNDLQIVHPQGTGLHHCHRDTGLRRGVAFVRADAPEGVSQCSSRCRMAMQQNAHHDELHQGCSCLTGDRPSPQRANMHAAGIIERSRAGFGTKFPPLHLILRGRHPPFNTAPVADSQRSSDPLFKRAHARIAKGGGLILLRALRRNRRRRKACE